MIKLRKFKFTAVELLIVLVLIAFLFTIIMPGLIRAREIAKKIYCLNNLDQTAKIARMYNLDYGQTPYSSTWLIDFSFLTKYVQNYGIMECPEMDDSVVSDESLVGGTSYHYMGSRQDWEKNSLASGDGSEYGFDAMNPAILTKLSSRDEKLIYDKSDTVHYGRFNVVYLESGRAESIEWTNSNNYWFLLPAGTLNFDDGDVPDRRHNRNQYRYRHRFQVRGSDNDAPGDDPDNPGVGGNDDPGVGGADDPGVGGNDDPEVGGGDDPGLGGGTGSGSSDDPEDDDPDDDPKPWKARIIHYPPGNPGNPQEITIGWSAWPAHQAHGDELVEIIYK